MSGIQPPDSRLHLQLWAWRGSEPLKAYLIRESQRWSLFRNLVYCVSSTPVVPCFESSGLVAEALSLPWEEIEDRLEHWRCLLWRSLRDRGCLIGVGLGVLGHNGGQSAHTVATHLNAPVASAVVECTQNITSGEVAVPERPFPVLPARTEVRPGFTWDSEYFESSWLPAAAAPLVIPEPLGLPPKPTLNPILFQYCHPTGNPSHSPPSLEAQGAICTQRITTPSTASSAHSIPGGTQFGRVCTWRSERA
jgi:hypothetical protein